MRRIVLLFALMLSMTSCDGSWTCYSEDTAPQSGNTLSIVGVTSSVITGGVAGVTPNVRLKGNEPVLIKVSGQVNVCALPTQNTCNGGSCAYGVPYAVPAMSSYWIRAGSIPANSSVVATVIYPSIKDGITDGNGCANSNPSTCQCSDFGLQAPNPCSDPTNCGSNSCQSASYCAASTSCQDLTFGNKWNSNGGVSGQTFNASDATPSSTNSGNWYYNGAGLQVQMGYFGNDSEDPHHVLDNSNNGTDFLSPDHTTLNSNSNGSITSPNNVGGSGISKLITNSDSVSHELFFRINAPTRHNALGGYNVYVSAAQCIAQNGSIYNSENPFGDLSVTVVNQSQNTTTTQALEVYANKISSCANLNSVLAQGCNSSDFVSNAANYYLVTPTGDGSIAFQINTGSSNTSNGSLQITVYSSVQTTIFSKLINIVITEVRSRLTSSIQTIFTNITQLNSNYVTYIRLLLTLYIVIYGIMFIGGMIKISQFDLIKRIGKLAIIIALISPNSWNFFANNLFNLFLNGTNDLIAIFNGDGGYATSSTQNPFSFVDKVFYLLYENPVTWKRILSILGTPTGFILAILIIWSIVEYAIGMLECVVSYIMSILVVSILLVLAPIFIPFILFAQTMELFTGWIKMLTFYTLKPVILIIGFNMLNMILYITIQEVLSFPVCFSCNFPVQIKFISDFVDYLSRLFNLPDFFFCIPGFHPWGSSSSGDGNAFYLGFSSIVLFFLIARLIKNLPDFVSDLTQRLTNLRDIALKTEGGTGSTLGREIASNMLGAAKWTVGLGGKLQGKRQDAAIKELIKQRQAANAAANPPANAPANAPANGQPAAAPTQATTPPNTPPPPGP